MRDPCPYCGLPGVSFSRVDNFTKEIVNDIREHDCPEWAPKPRLSREATDTSFVAEARDTAEGLERYRASLRKIGEPTQAIVSCGICKQPVSVGYDAWTRHARGCQPVREGVA
jgi:hypothetical protein